MGLCLGVCSVYGSHTMQGSEPGHHQTRNQEAMLPVIITRVIAVIPLEPRSWRGQPWPRTREPGSHSTLPDAGSPGNSLQPSF